MLRRITLLLVSQNGIDGQLEADGWVKLSNGLMIEWGNTKWKETSTTITFPKPFPHNVLSITASKRTDNAFTWTPDHALAVSYFNKNNCVITARENAVSTIGFFWIAIGY